MTDKDRYVDETLKKQIQESYGASDEQLKARMDRIERTLTDDEFAGAEDRIMAKLMARIGAPEPKEETVKTVTEVVTEAVVEITEEVAEETSGVYEVVAEVEEETSATTVAGEEKVIRFGRKKVILVAALAAAFIGALAVTTIGENSYFFREREKEIGVVFNSGKNISEASELDDAYIQIKEAMESDIFALGYLPSEALFNSLMFGNGTAVLEFKYKENYFYFVQSKGSVESSIAMESDREINEKVYNSWLNVHVLYGENKLENEEFEFEARIEDRGMIMYIFGVMEREEFEEILKNIYFY